MIINDWFMIELSDYWLATDGHEIYADSKWKLDNRLFHIQADPEYLKDMVSLGIEKNVSLFTITCRYDEQGEPYGLYCEPNIHFNRAELRQLADYLNETARN